MNLQLRQQEFILLFDKWLNTYLQESQKNKNYSSVLLQSQSYSLLSGGKRFRPFLAFLVFKLFADDLNKIKNLCLALEIIHTYSLIHDDLPCMDNDDLRRGKPTNHKVFSEDISLLAGDGLLSDAFFILAADDSLRAQPKIDIIRLIAEKIGSRGMVSGQALDMKVDSQISFDELKKIHKLKTAHLIEASAVGAAIAAECSVEVLSNISEFSYNLGMAFQIKDDLLDQSDKQQDFKSYLVLLGFEKTKKELNEHSKLAKIFLEKISINLNQMIDKNSTIGVLLELIDFNLARNS